MRGLILKTIGWTLKTIGLLIIAVSFAVFLAARPIADEEGYVVGFLVAMIAAILGVIGSRLYRLGKQYAARERAAKTLEDPRPPVLYLRAFRDDTLTSSALESEHPAPWSSTLDLVTQEERLAKALNPIGPFIALGRPGERLPTLGATRRYVSDENWREEVGRMVKGARLVIIRAAVTPSVLWEVRTAKKHLRPEQLVLLVPSDQEVYEAFRSEVRGCLPSELPELREQLSDLRRKEVLPHVVSVDCGVITFDDCWRPSFSPFTAAPGREWKQGTYAYGLRPVFAQLGVEWRKPPFEWRVILGIAVLAIVFLGTVLLIILL